MNLIKKKNISFWDEIISRLKSYKSKVRSSIEYRRTYSNYLHVIIHHLKGDFPVDATLKDGNNITLLNPFQAYIITQLHRYNQISYSIPNDMVTISSLTSKELSGQENMTAEVKLYGAVSNGEVVECFMTGAYETLPVNGKTVIDVGSNIGDSSIYFALRGADKVIALEPFFKNYETAKKNIESNNLSNRITILLAGCAANPGYTTLNPNYKSDVSSRLSGVMDDAKDNITVPLLTLEDILKDNNIPPGSVVLKMDCEGCENESIISASNETLQMFSHIQIEYHHGYKNLKEKLEKSNFKVSVTRPIKSNKLYIGYIFAKKI